MHRKQRTALWVMGLVLTASGLACTSTQNVGVTSSEPSRRDECFNSSLVRSFSPLSGRYVYVRVERDKHYLLTLDFIYTSLPFATRIAISSDFSRVCSDTGATITFVDSGRTALARILRVEVVASREAAQKLVDEHANPKPKS